MTEIRTHRLRSAVSASGIAMAVATFVLVVQLGDVGQFGVADTVERTQGRPATYAIDITAPASPRALTSWLQEARGPEGLSLDVVPLFRIGDIRLSAGNMQPISLTLIATDSQVAEVVGRPLVTGAWWQEREGRLDVPLVVSEGVASELVSLTGIEANDLGGKVLRVDPSGFAMTLIGIVPDTALSRYVGTAGYALLPLDSLETIPPESVDIADVQRLLLVDEPQRADTMASTVAARLSRAAVLKDYRPIQVDAARVDTAGAFAGATRALRAIFIAIGFIALGVGALGIANIAMASLRARVAEFGLRRAVGATPTDIFSMVITESGVLGLAGGVVGTLLALIASFVLEPWAAQNLGVPFVPVQPNVAVLGFFASVTAGLLAGVMPARVARRLSVLDALRAA